MEKTEGTSTTEQEEDLARTLKALEIIMGKSKEEAIAEAIKDLSSELKVEFYSDLDKREVPFMATLAVIARRYNVLWLDDWLNIQLKLRVSHRRKGRTELVRTIIGHKKTLEERVKGFFRRGEKEETE